MVYNNSTIMPEAEMLKCRDIRRTSQVDQNLKSVEQILIDRNVVSK